MLAALPSVRLSLPSPRSIDAFESWVEIEMVSAPEPPMSVSTFEIEPVLAASARVNLSLPELISIVFEPEMAPPRVTVSLPELPTSVSTFGMVRLPTLPLRMSLSLPDQRSIVHVGRHSGERDRIVIRAAENALDVGDGRRVGG